jgi:tetratricopeptide (TPR) repeat protein
MKPLALASALVLVVAAVAAAPAAAAPPSVWSRVRAPGGEALVAEAEDLVLKQHALRAHPQSRLFPQEAETLGRAYLTRAAALMDQAGVPRSRDLFVREELAEIYGLIDEPAKQTALLEAVLRADPPEVLRSRAWAELAVAYAHQGRIDDEIRAYGEALRGQPMAGERARLLANRAEAYMLLGDITAAVEGYRAALGLLSTDYLLFGGGATTLWGLAVALDRSGDLDAGLESVRLARSYDPRDESLKPPAWFFLPRYDEHWYAALGHWQVARKTDMGSVRAEAYLRAVAAWDSYVAEATTAGGDKWIALARVRRKQCEKERLAFLKRDAAERAAEAGRKGKKPDAPRAPLTPEELMRGWATPP